MTVQYENMVLLNKIILLRVLLDDLGLQHVPILDIKLESGTAAKLVLSNYGMPKSNMSQVPGKPTVWQREYENATVTLDCATFSAAFVEK